MLIGEGERKIMIPKKHAMQLEKITKLMNHSMGDSVKDGVSLIIHELLWAISNIENSSVNYRLIS
ncbi:MAG: hypothetical protein Q8R84_13260 [Candidatus Nitrotoga sp.]|nr:hypothetical protein [Candidatus Nitrotoga sp.]